MGRDNPIPFHGPHFFVPSCPESLYGSFATLYESTGYICAFLNNLLFFLPEIFRISKAIEDASLVYT